MNTFNGASNDGPTITELAEFFRTLSALHPKAHLGLETTNADDYCPIRNLTYEVIEDSTPQVILIDVNESTKNAFFPEMGERNKNV